MKKGGVIMNESKININVSFSELNSEQYITYLAEEIRQQTLKRCDESYHNQIIKLLKEIGSLEDILNIKKMELNEATDNKILEQLSQEINSINKQIPQKNEEVIRLDKAMLNSKQDADSFFNQHNNQYVLNMKISRKDFFTKQSEVLSVFQRLVLESESKNLMFLHKFNKINIEITEDLKENLSEDELSNTPVHFSYSQEEFDVITNFYSKVKNTGFMGSVNFSNNFTKATLQEVSDVNGQIDLVVNNIKSNQFTPFEAMTYIHNYIQDHCKYRGIDSRSYSILKAVSGEPASKAELTSLTKAIIDRLDWKDLKCDIETFKASASKYSFGLTTTHPICLITINDAKYNINGKYLNDVAAELAQIRDSQFHTDTQFGRFTYFMFPKSDIYSLKGFDFEEIQANSISQQLLDASESKLISSPKTKPLDNIKNKISNLFSKAEIKPIQSTKLIEAIHKVYSAKVLNNPKNANLTDAEKFSKVDAITLTLYLQSLTKARLVFEEGSQNIWTSIWKKAGYYACDTKKETIQSINSTYASVKQDVIKFINELSQNELPEIPD